ncbi:MAG: hypothetical protein HY764_03695 [Candidatus Portnoybacteria bacterium]|nr:hypothetical protein [Candidatus Portnoybacteria bacterium]
MGYQNGKRQYNYHCVNCESADIVFVNLSGAEVNFECKHCGRKFATKDMESAYIHHKVNSLQRRYPVPAVETH